MTTLAQSTMATEPAQQKIVLEMCELSFRSSGASLRVINVDVKVLAGDLLFIKLLPQQSCRSFVSMLQGLTKPESGKVQFDGCDWATQSDENQLAMRSRMGRVFQDRAWVQNFNIRDNLFLSPQHAGVGVDTLEDRLQFWLKYFDVLDPLHRRPAFAEPSLLQVYQWIRALLVQPMLMLLERPMDGADPSLLPKLINAINDQRKRETAVLWFTSNEMEMSGGHAKPSQIRRFNSSFEPTSARESS